MDLLSQYASFLSRGGLIPYALRGLDYLRRAVLGDPSPTTGVSDAYTPPFTGGQCSILYYVEIRYFNGGVPSGGINLNDIGGPIQGTKFFSPSGSAPQWYLVHNGGATNRQITNTAHQEARITLLRPMDGQPPDNCGNLPNPNGSRPISSDGVATSAPLNFTSAAVTGVVSGTALAADGTDAIIDGGKADFTDAGVLAPTNIGGALAKIASGLFRVLELLSILNDVLELLKKLFNKDNKSSFSYDFGNLRYDGFVRLQSEPASPNITPLYLDLQTTAVKVGSSRIFGEKSPNYYFREPIGYIHFVSPTFGVLYSHEIRFVRTSIPIPSLAYGFFYNLGLDGVNRANATGFYLKQEE